MKLVIGIVRPEKSNDVLAALVRFEIAVSDEFVEPAIEALCQGGQTGQVGDGKIFVVPLERVVRIRTGETDDGAVTPVGG